MRRLGGFLPLVAAVVVALGMAGAAPQPARGDVPNNCMPKFQCAYLTIGQRLNGSGWIRSITSGVFDGNIACRHDWYVSSGQCEFGYALSPTGHAQVRLDFIADAKSSVCTAPDTPSVPDYSFVLDVTGTTTFTDLDLCLLKPAVVAVTRSGTGAGTVSSTPAGLVCGSICTLEFVDGGDISLTAKPATGSRFAGWTGACAGQAATCHLTVFWGPTVNVNGIFDNALLPTPTPHATASPVPTAHATPKPSGSQVPATQSASALPGASPGSTGEPPASAGTAEPSTSAEPLGTPGAVAVGSSSAPGAIGSGSGPTADAGSAGGPDWLLALAIVAGAAIIGFGVYAGLSRRGSGPGSISPS